MLSYPRSGSHLVRYLIEYLSGECTLGCLGNREKDTPICQRSDVLLLSRVSLKNPVATKWHFASQISEPGESLILILRHPIEAMVSHFWHTFMKLSISEIYRRHFPDLVRKLGSDSFRYIENLNYFDSFSGKKCVIVYEELLGREFKKELLRLNEFLEFLPDYNYFLKLIGSKDEIYYDCSKSLLQPGHSSSLRHFSDTMSPEYMKLVKLSLKLLMEHPLMVKYYGENHG